MNRRSFLAMLLWLACSFVIHSQTLYWVGGSGNFNDPAHWSLSTGGASANKVPGSLNDVVFDNNSLNGVTAIVMPASASVRSFNVNTFLNTLYFTGSRSSVLNCAGSLALSDACNFNTFQGTIIFRSFGSALNRVNFGLRALNCDLSFKQGNYSVGAISQNPGYKASFEGGSYRFRYSSLVTDRLDVKGTATSFKIDTSYFNIRQSVFIRDKSSFEASVFNFYAPFSDPANVVINQAITFGTRVISSDNTTFATCTASVYPYASCGVCNAVFSLVIDPACTGTYNVFVVNSDNSCSLTANNLSANDVTAGTYTFGSACNCLSTNYAIFLQETTSGVFTFPVSQLNGSGNSFNFPVTTVTAVTTSSTAPSCNTSCNGSMSLLITSGTSPYTVAVSPSSVTPTFTTTGNISISGLCGGVYTFTITDASGCAGIVTRTVTAPSQLNANPVTTSITCNGVCNGAFSIRPGSTGTPNYTVNFSPGGTFTTTGTGTVIAGSLCPGVISATLTDSKGCKAFATTTITQPPALTVTPTQTNVTCGGLCTGVASVAVSGGTSPYTYSWSAGSFTTPGASSLCAGNYSVTVKDNNNCTFTPTPTFSITQPASITISPSITNVSCNGQGNGSATVSATGGSAAITFTWVAPGNSTISITPTVTPLSPGIYTVFAKDALSCVVSKTISISEPPTLTLTTTSQSIQCIGACTGSANALVSGGNGGPFSYSWTPGAATQTTQSISSLCAGVYVVSVKDASNCSVSATVTIQQPTTFTPAMTSSSVTCNAGCNGSIGVTPTGGTAPFNYTLASATSTVTSASPSFTGLCAGSYTLSITDVNSPCAQQFTVTISEPGAIIPSISTTTITCFNQCNGVLSGNAIGGIPGYTYTWATPTGTVAGGIISNRCVGNYTLNVKDANNCVKSLTTALVQPPDITFTITPVNASCFGNCNGALSANVTGGTPGYTLNWSNGASGTPNTSLCAGSYTLNITDLNGCPKSGTATITSPASIAITQTVAQTLCAASCDGSATITATGGASTFTYNFSVGPSATNTTGLISGLCAGSYVSNVTDVNGCNQSIGFSITSPVALSAAITGNQGSCSSCTGAATITASNGQPGYSYAWTNSLSATVSTTTTASALCPGNYTVLVTDSKSCTATTTLNISQTVVAAPVSGGTGIQCFGACTGSAVASPSGGSPPYTYTWQPTGQNTQTATALCAGIYTVTVKEGSSSGCTGTSTINIVGPSSITVSGVKTNITCAGLCNGVITATASGGTGLLSYSWSPGGQTTQSINSLCAGTYSLKVTDANGCTSAVQIFTITEPSPIAATFTNTPPTTCTLSNGSICSSASGGSGGPYTYTWLPGGTTSSCIAGLMAGSYSVIVSDGVAGCTNTLATLLNNPNGPTLTLVASQSVACFGGSTGAATVSATGSAPFSFTWMPAPAVASTSIITSASGLTTGTYVVTAQDVNSCVRSITVPIVQASSLTLNATVTNPRCNNAVCNGSVMVAAPSGGSPGYTFSWSPGGATTQSLPNICAGNYSLTVTDSHTCLNTYTYAVIAPPVFTITSTSSSIRCNGVCNGSIVANASGGTAPISYSWVASGAFTGSTTATVLNLCAGIYTINAFDGNNCLALGTNTIQITEPPLLSSTLVLQNASCSNSCNALATLSATGGVTPYNFSWSSGGATTPTLGSLCAGNYTGTVSDANGCVSAKGFTVVPPPAFAATLIPSNPKCNPLSNPVCSGSVATTISGAQGAVVFNWAPSGSGQSPVNLCSGSYTLTATDANACQVLQVVNLVDPPALLSNVTFTNPSCNGACNGRAVISPTNAVGAVSVTWTPAAPNSPTITNLCAGDYIVNISDANGCRDVQTFTLLSPPALTVNASSSAASCLLSNGSISLAASGGSPGIGGYTYNWAPPVVSTTSVASNLAANIYSVAVSDGVCTNTLTVTLNNANGPTSAPIISTSVACHGQCTGAASINPASITGGTPGYTVTWLSPPAQSPMNPLTNLCAGVYTAKINDANGCILFNGVTISEPNAVSTLPSIGFPTCAGVCNGSISLATSGGNTPYTYTWMPALSTTSVLLNACPGDYTVIIGYGGASNCTSAPQVFSLPAVTDIGVTTAVTPNPCFGNCVGTASIATATGVGSSLFTYAWSNGQNGASATNFCNGNYSVMATAPNGCTNTFTFDITSPSQITSTLSITQPSCNQCNGGAAISSSGGTGPGYTYSWTTGANSASVSNLCAGLYQVIVTDQGSNCQQTQTVTVNSSSGITGETFNTQNILCAGTCNGSTTVTAIGGTTPISYTWLGPVSSSSVLSNLCAGTYFVQMADAQGCLRTSSVSITAATSLTLSEFIRQPSCMPTVAGSINVIVTGGTPAYTFSWQPTGATTSSLTGLNAGMYSLTVTDASAAHCSLTQVYNISNLPGPVITFTQSNVKCSGACTGSISVSVSGSGNTFSWTTGSTSQSVTNLCAGLISLTVTGSNGCITIKTFTITENAPLQINTPQITQPSCNLCNGSSTVTTFGGVLPYTYSWTTNATGPSVSNLCAGLYEVTVADSVHCQQTFTVIVNNSNGITGQNFNVHNVSCANNCDGSVTVTAVGGNAPITYNWVSPAVSGSVISNLCANTYFVQMSDAQNCIRTASVDVTATTSLTVLSSVISPTCNGLNGAITLSVSGGTPTYALAWSPGSNTTPTLSGLGAGSYSVTIHDSAPGTCTVTQTFNLSNTTGPVLTASQGDIKCFGACTGSIGISATMAGNPSATFLFNWSNGAGTPTVTGVCSGVITVTVTDVSSGCKTIKSFTINENAELFLNPPAVVQPSCNMCNGTASVSAFGGVVPYQYLWTNSSTLSAISGLCAGLYQVTISDALGCSQTINVIINNSNGITGETFNVNNISCAGDCNGSATVTAVGGNAPITYSWLNPPLTNSIITNLCAGNYFVQMSDAQNCLRTASVDITSAPGLSVTAAVVSPTCNGLNGAITLSISGGTPTYSILWSPGAATTPSLAGIGAGTYSVSVHDSAPGACTVTQQFNVSNTTGPVLTFTQSNIRCSGACTGSLNIAATSPGNPSATFIYNWSNGAASSAITGLCSGVITLTVTDVVTGCKTLKTFTLTENSPIIINSPAVVQPSCNRCNGTASVSVFGGVAPYQYVWTNSAITPAIADLCAGLYQVQVTDEVQCSSTHNVLINNSSGITGQTFNVQNIQCSNSCSGAATVTAVGGSAPITYNWVNPVTAGPVINNLCAGDYFVQMTDAQGCIRTASVEISAPNSFTISTLIVPPTCGAVHPDGSASVTVTGGSGSYQYSWTPSGNTTAQITGVAAGGYSVVVTDATSGCSLSANVNLSNPTGPAVTFTPSDISCFGACTGSIVAVSTSTSALTYSWSAGIEASIAGSSTVTGLCKGVVTVTVTDINGCQTVSSFTLGDNSKLQLSIPNIVQPSCHNSCDGQITLLPSGGSLPYLSFSWTPTGSGSNNNPQTGLCAGDSTARVYTVVINDAKGCVNTSTVVLQNPADIALSYSLANAACSSVADGSIAISPSGGVPSYTPQWTGPDQFSKVTQTITNLFPGSYTLHLLDQKGCSKDTVFNLISTTTVQANAGPDPTVCPGTAVILTATGSTGSGTITYSWFSGSNTVTPVSTTASLNIPSATDAATYILQVNSSVPGCFDRKEIHVNLLSEPIVDAGPTFTIPVYSTVTIGGSPTAFGDVSVVWTPSLTLNDPTVQNPVASNTLDVTYTVMVTDNRTGCTASDSVQVILYPAIIIPNGFTPNGDGRNDRWIIDYLDQFPDNRVEVYNRWGELLFLSKGYTTPFDGRYHGKELPVGTYYYVINLNHPAYPKAFTGPLTIFR